MITAEERRALLDRAITTYGAPAQMDMAVEEMADLTADNRIAELATTDNKMLAEVFADIDTGEIPFMLSGYTEDDYGNIVTALS